MKKIGLDIDGLLANFTQGVIDVAKTMELHEHFPRSWEMADQYIFSKRFNDVWVVIKDDPSFWLNLPPFEGMAEAIDFPVDAYVTARPIGSDVTEEWLRRNGFPKAPVTSVPFGASKVKKLDGLDIRLFIDDYGENFKEIREGGLTTCLLYDRLYNQTYDATGLRIHHLSEVKRYML